MVVYNKNIDKPGRASKTGSSPRDRQMRVAADNMRGDGSSALIASLTEQVIQLRNELTKRPTQGYTDEEFNNEVIKAVEASIAKEREANSRYILELENKTKDGGDTKESLARIAKLESTVESLNKVIEGKEETIEVLKSRPNILMADGVLPEYEDVNKSDRPQMEEHYIDPSATDTDYKSNITVEDVRDTQKEDMSNKVNKLKDLLGGSISK